jgi:hypothetical protein
MATACRGFKILTTSGRRWAWRACRGSTILRRSHQTEKIGGGGGDNTSRACRGFTILTKTTATTTTTTTAQRKDNDTGLRRLYNTNKKVKR